MAVVVLPSLLGAQAGGQRRFELDAATVGQALRALPVADLILDDAGDINRYLNVYVGGTDARERGGLACPLVDADEVRIVAMISGG
ncbi:hypothetical protein ACQPXM_23425 [Kribbella sp. CA-253562]|uniref:hypothetical protein n=1 Tax=Kribbella sp. CA-253562 TaxID=3239942 RepID=UPI003D8AAB80